MRVLAQGHLSKMATSINAVPKARVAYQLQMGGQSVDMNALVGRTIRLQHLGEIKCSHCGRKTKKSYSQGYCYPCMQKLPQCDLCIMSPERCHYDQGTCRDASWGEGYCMQPHVIYLANSSALKVGITRVNQMPTRWLDQGASQAVPIMQVATRKLSGQVETVLKNYVADKTNWRALLKGEAMELDLLAECERLKAEAAEPLQGLLSGVDKACYTWLQHTPTSMQYPVQQYPTKIVSHNLDKESVLEDQLLGIKGQYLIFANRVINIRKYSSYLVQLCA
ncbi:MAG: DUF2797 domain-containing protein [Gammaproteobacteria bacterium]|nr:DUF2797 domain-containing protein [Gammaproteobacteria bacterium]MCP4881896.1 DUF2797 domain-containing protein [Gammaproteobacteria bacterium]